MGRSVARHLTNNNRIYEFLRVWNEFHTLWELLLLDPQQINIREKPTTFYSVRSNVRNLLCKTSCFCILGLL